MDEYKILNSVKPAFLKTKYPYNWLDPSKIIATQKHITIMAKELSSNKSDKLNKSKKTGGHTAMITFYG